MNNAARFSIDLLNIAVQSGTHQRLRVFTMRWHLEPPDINNFYKQ